MSRTLLLAAVCLVGCSDRSGKGPEERPADVLDAYEAVFRYRLQNEKGDVRAYLSIDGKDPSADLLKRLRRDWSNLKPISEEPKEKGLRISVEGLQWMGRDAAQVQAGYWFPTRFAGEGYFADHHLVRRGGKWVVEKVTNETMS